MPLITRSFHLPRRAVLAGLLGTSLGTFIPSVALGLSEKVAIDFTSEVMDVIRGIISSSTSEEQMLRDFQSAFNKYTHVPLIAKTALGAPGRRATSSQLAAYIKAFEVYISRKYGRQFHRLAGDTFAVKGSRDAGSKGVLVQFHVDQVNKPSYDVEWWVIEVDGKPKLFDIILEGISMLSSERTEIGALLESVGGDIDKMTARLKAS